MRVFVYRNLHKKCLSVRNVKTGLVIAHVDTISLRDCKFKVSQKGRQRVLKEKRKNVHAGVEGNWVQEIVTPDLLKCVKIVYNPYKYDSFVEQKTLSPVVYAETALVTVNGTFIKKYSLY